MQRELIVLIERLCDLVWIRNVWMVWCHSIEGINSVCVH